MLLYDFLSFALANPSIVFKVLSKKNLNNEEREKITLAFIDKIEEKCNLKRRDVQRFSFEFKDNKKLIDYIKNSLKDLENTGAFNPTFQTVIYSLMRNRMPENVVETGVANGVSSTIILTALDLNKKGQLYSIDLPTIYWENSPYREFDKVQVKNNKVGWIVPNDLRNKWHLTLGKSQEKLPEVLNSIKTCDIFFHDSEHSYENMMFEFNTAWPYIVQGGIIIADDVNRNNAFGDFVNSHKNEMTSLKIGQFGFILKK